MPNQYSKLTAENISVKMNRRKNPVTSIAQLAREFGYETRYPRSDGRTSHRAPKNFTYKVRELIGEDQFQALRDRRSLNHMYR